MSISNTREAQPRFHGEAHGPELRGVDCAKKALPAIRAGIPCEAAAFGAAASRRITKLDQLRFQNNLRIFGSMSHSGPHANIAK